MISVGSSGICILISLELWFSLVVGWLVGASSEIGNEITLVSTGTKELKAPGKVQLRTVLSKVIAANSLLVFPAK